MEKLVKQKQNKWLMINIKKKKDKINNIKINNNSNNNH